MKLLKNNKFKVYIFLFSIAILIIYPGCYKKTDYSTNSTNNEPPALNEIFMQNMAFTPADMSITVGTTIKWTNKDGTAHTVTDGTPGSLLGLFDSGNIAPNGAFTFTFNQAGTYKYFCRIHPMMIGTIIVTSPN